MSWKTIKNLKHRRIEVVGLGFVVDPPLGENDIELVVMLLIEHAGWGWLRRVGKFLNPGPAGSLFIAFFVILLAVMGPIVLRIGKLFVRPILWLYESRNYSVGLSLTGSVIPAIAAIALAWSLRRRGRRAVPAVMANKWFWVFATIYAVVITALPIISPIAAAVLLSLNTPMILITPLFIITIFDLAREVKRSDYLIAALLTTLLLPTQRQP